MSHSSSAKTPTPPAEQANPLAEPPQPQQQQQDGEQPPQERQQTGEPQQEQEPQREQPPPPPTSPGQPQPQPSTPSLFMPSSLSLQQDTKSETNSRSPHLRLQDLSSTADLRCSFAHSRPLEIMESIKGLHELHQQGGLTQEEFTQAKQQILDSGSSADTVPSTKSKQTPKRRRRRHGRHSSSSSDSTDSHGSHGKRSYSTGGKSHTKTRSTRRRSSRKSKSSDDSSSSSTSSDSSDDRFIVVPRANVWRSLNAHLDDGSIDHESAILHLGTSADGSAAVQSPLLVTGTTAEPFRVTPMEEPVSRTAPSARTRVNGYEPIPGDDPLSQRDARDDLTAAVPSPNGGDALAPSPNSVTLATDSGVNSAEAGGAPNTAAAMVAAAAALGRHPGSLTSSDNREKAKYGTFLSREETMRVGGMTSIRAELNREDVVRVKYFNSRGRAGNHFNDVELHTSEMREPIFLHKGYSQVVEAKPPSSTSATRRTKEDMLMAVLPVQDSQSVHVAEMTPDERKAWEEMSSLPSRSSTSPSSRSSYLEQSLNWYWIDVTGRDPTRKRYNATLRFLTNRFKLCESFLVDRDHMLVLPQICESPNYPGQYLLNLRVATDKIAISDDSVMELTNRWIIVVDLRQHLVITLHRVDTHSMANLRMLWRKVIENNDVSFQEFLLKIIDDAIRTYQTSIDVHADILDKCEAKLFVETSANTVPVASGHYIDMRILHHFAGSSRSLFLRRLLDDQDRSPMNKGEMNSFLHHLHRRTSVQHRMLNLTQAVLVKAFTKLRLCSKEMADQMCASCIEVSDRALEVRDDAKTLLDLHISLQSFRTNELMAVLTRVSLLFPPVTFLAGVYGMNFQKNFPELTWAYGYPFFWVLSGILVVVMQFFFLREK